MSQNHQKITIIAAMTAFFVTVMGYAVWKWLHLAYNGMDLAIYAQALWNTVHGRLLTTSIHPPSMLGDHAEWLWLVIAPAYAVLPHPLVLVAVQTMALASCGWIVWRMAGRMLTERWALGAGLATLFLPVLGHAALYEFHPLVFALPLLLLAADAFIQKRFVWFVIWMGVALLVREDVALTVIMFGLIALIEKRSWKWITVPIAVSIIWFILMQYVISHFASDGYKYAVYYAWLFPLDVGVLFRHLFSLPQLEFLIGLLLPVLFIPLRKPKWLLLSVPAMAQVMLTAPGAGDVTLQMHYAVIPTAGIIIAALHGLSAVIQKLATEEKRFSWLLHDRRLVAIVLATAVIGSAALLGPFVRGLWVLQTPPSTAGYGLVQSRIPKNASVAASYRALPHLADRTDLIAVRYLGLGIQQFGRESYEPSAPEYIVFDDDDFLLTSADAHLSWTASRYRLSYGRLRKILDDGAYGLVLRDGSVSVWQKGAPRIRLDIAPGQLAEISPDLRMGVAEQPVLCPGSRATCTVLLFQPQNTAAAEYFVRITARTAKYTKSTMQSFRLLPSFDWSAGQSVTLPLAGLPFSKKDTDTTYTAEIVHARPTLTLNALGTTTVMWSEATTIGQKIPFARLGAGSDEVPDVRP